MEATTSKPILEDVEPLSDAKTLLPSADIEKHKIAKVVHPGNPDLSIPELVRINFGWGTPYSTSIRFPTNLVSPEAIEFCGFDSSTAHRLYEKWTTRRPSKRPHTLKHYVVKHIRRCVRDSRCRVDSSSDLFGLLKETISWMGLNEEVQNVIIDNSHRKTLESWVLKTVGTKYRRLRRLQRHRFDGTFEERWTIRYQQLRREHNEEDSARIFLAELRGC